MFVNEKQKCRWGHFLLHSLLPVPIFAYVCVRARMNAHANTQMAFCTMVQPSAPMCQSHLIRVQRDSSARLYPSKHVWGVSGPVAAAPFLFVRPLPQGFTLKSLLRLRCSWAEE